MTWLFWIGLFALVPVAAGFLIHAGSGGRNSTESAPRSISRSGRVRTVARHTITTLHEVPAEQLKAGERA